MTVWHVYFENALCPPGRQRVASHGHDYCGCHYQGGSLSGYVHRAQMLHAGLNVSSKAPCHSINLYCSYS